MGSSDDSRLEPLIIKRIRPRTRVLHVGCRAGDLMLVLESQLRCETVGIDPDPAAAALAQERGLQVVVADLAWASLPELVDNQLFDTVIITGVLQHLADPGSLLLQLPRVLREQGSAIVAFPNVTHVDIQLLMAQDDWPEGNSYSGTSRQLSHFNLRSFSEIAVRAGLEVSGRWPVEDPAPGALAFSADRPLLMDSPRLQAMLEANRGNPAALVRAYVVELRLAGSGAEQLPSPLSRPGTELGPRAEAELEVVVVTAGERPQQLKEALYSLAALSEIRARAVVVVQSDRADVADKVRGLLEHYAGLLTVAMEVRAGGLGSAFNVGLRKLESEYAVFMSDQDVLYPTFAQTLLPRLRTDRAASAAYGRGRIVLGTLTEAGFSTQGYGAERGEPFDRVRLFVDEYISLSACLLRVDVLRSLGVRFSEAPGVEVKWALLCQMAALSGFQYAPETVAETRLGPTSGPTPPEEPALTVARTRRAVLEALAGRTVRMTGSELADLADRLVVGLAEGTGRRLGEELKESQLLLNRLLQSRSWKLTRPLRRISRSDLPE